MLRPRRRRPCALAHRVGFAIVAVLVAGCSAPITNESAKQERSAITNGRSDVGDPSVVALVYGRGPLCTGVLVSSRVVVTAAHCVTPLRPDAVAFGHSFAEDAGEGAPRIAVAAVTPHPSFDPRTLGDDIAVVELASDATVAPARLDLAAPAPPSGAPVRIVGFAAVDRWSAPERHQGSAVVRAVDGDALEIAAAPSLPCAGDSGGGVFAGDAGDETLVAIVSRGDPGCVDHGWATRLDTHAAFVRGAVEAEAPSTPDRSAAASCAVTFADPPSSRTIAAFGLFAALTFSSRRPSRKRKTNTMRGTSCDTLFPMHEWRRSSSCSGSPVPSAPRGVLRMVDALRPRPPSPSNPALRATSRSRASSNATFTG